MKRLLILSVLSLSLFAQTGNQTINKAAFSVNFVAAATSLVVTNSLVGVNSIVVCTIATNDATAINVRAVPAAGSVTLYVPAATAETRASCIVVNQ